MNILSSIIYIYELLLNNIEFINNFKQQGVIKTLIDGIAFISNMEDVMMGKNNYYKMEDVNNTINVISNKNQNFKALINNYVLNDYQLHDNIYLVKDNYLNKIFSFIKLPFLIIENLLIGSQKLFYEYINYFQYLFNWYSNFKILIDKSIINTNIREELYYNISLELLSDIQNEHNKAFWWTIKNVKELKKNILIQIFKNYFKVFKESPYRLTIELINLHKKYTKINILSYGLDYDINVLTHNKYILSTLNADILSAKNNFIYSDKSIKNIDKEQYFVSNNNTIWEQAFEKRNYYDYIGTKINDYMLRFVDDKWDASGNFIRQTYTKPTLHLLNNRFWNFDILKNSILVYPWSNFNLKWNIYYPEKIILKDLNWENFPWNFIRVKKINWNFFILHQPDSIFRFIQEIGRFFVGVDENETVISDKVTSLIAGKKEISNLKNLSNIQNDIKNIPELKMRDLVANTKEGVLDLYRLKKLYGGYSYWWAWHQDATYLYEEKFYPSKILKQIEPGPFYTIYGRKPFYFTPINFFPDLKIHLNHINDYKMHAQANLLRKVLLDSRSTSSEVFEKVEEMDKIAEYEEKRKLKEEAEQLAKIKMKKKKIFMDKNTIIEDDGILEDRTLEQIKEDKKRDRVRITLLDERFEGKSFSQIMAIVKKAEMQEKLKKIDELREKQDPLHLSPNKRFKKPPVHHHIFDMPELKTINLRRQRGGQVMDHMHIKIRVPKKIENFKDKGLVRVLKKVIKKDGEKITNWKWLTTTKYKKVNVALHGNIGLHFTKSFFKTYLVANDSWVKFSFIKKQQLLESYKPVTITKKLGDNTTHILRKWPNLKKKFGHYVKLTDLAKHNDAYKKFINLEFKKTAVRQARLMSFIDGSYNELANYIEKGNIWDKKWLQEAKNISPSYMISKIPEELKPITRIDKFNFTHEDLLKMRVKYNTPLRLKEFSLPIHKTVKRGLPKAPVHLKYVILERLFQSYFYPEALKKIEVVKSSNRADLIFELNISKQEWIENMRENKMYNYNLKMKFDLYHNVIKPKFRVKFLKSKEMGDISMRSIRGFLMYKFNFDVFGNAEYLSTMDYLRRTPINWNNFYYTNIESITEPLNLNIIQKDFYGKQVNKDGFNAFLYKRKDLVNEAILPRNENILLKKTYIKNLIYVYEKEDKPMINYIFYILKKEDIKVIPESIWIVMCYIYEVISELLILIFEMYTEMIQFFIKLIGQELYIRFREVRKLKKLLDEYDPNFKLYIIISIIIFIYMTISVFLILIIKTFLPKNLIYGKLYEKNFEVKKDLKTTLDILHNHNNIEDIKAREFENTIKTIYELENIMDIDIDIDREKVHKDLKIYLKRYLNKNNIVVNDITIENLKKIEIYIKLKKNEKLKIRKNFFDAEHKYVYSWENKNFNLSDEIKKAKNSKKIIPIEDKRFLKKRIYINKFEENKINDLKKKYIIFYKNFIFEKNLEKWENNTKRRLEFFFNKENKGIIRLLLTDIWRAFLDRRFNHNRMLFWEDPELLDTSRLKYMFAVAKPFFNIFFIIRFVIGSLKLWDYNYWVSKWKQYVMFGIHAKINYKDLRGRLEKEWSLEWFKDEADYGRIQFKDFVKVIRKFKDIKQSYFLNKDINDKQTLRSEILDNIIDLTSEEDKLKQIREFLSYLKKIESDRNEACFDSRFNNIATKLIVNIDKIGPRKWAEQELRFKYRNKVYEQKLKIEKDEYEILKQSYTSRVKRDLDDKEKSLLTLQWQDERKVKTIMKQKIAAIQYERSIREYNYHNKFIDNALDAKEKIFYEAIKEYNEELSEEYLKIEAEEKEEKLQENIFEKKSRKLFGILDQNYIWFRWFTTMGARFNYLFVLIMGIFIGWLDNVKRIRKNELSITSLLKIMWGDFKKYIYKIYWEYLIIFNRLKALKNLGYSIIEILKFSIILTPIFFYSTFLYSIFLLYFIFIIILFVFPKKIYEKAKDKIIKKILVKKIINIIKNVVDYLVYIWKIINLLFKDVETGNTIWIELYNKLYKICGWLQYNFYMIKGAFILGYKKNNENNIKNGLIYIKNWLKLKYNAYIEQWKDKKIFSPKIWKIKIVKSIIKSIDNILLKIELLKIIMPIKPFFLKIRLKIWYYFYIKVGKQLFKIEHDEFVKIYNKNTELFRTYYKGIVNFFYFSINTAKQLKFKDFIILIIKTIFKTIWNFLILPFVFIKNHQKWKYVKNYKQGIQGFRDNPMYLIIDNPKKRKKHEWKVKLHNILMDQEISNYLKKLLYSTDTLIDIFFIFKIHEVKWTNKNYFQDYFWRKWYWKYKQFKEYVLNYLIDIAMKVEENYATFEENIETKNWSLWERFKYAYYTYKLYKHGMTRKVQQKKSRNIFFYNKIKDKKRIMRVYFFKGIINWITYITVNRVVFTKVHELKKKKNIYKYIKYKYKLKDIEAKTYIKNNIHITEHLKNTPPQLWSLIIMYEIYYKTLLRYRFEDETYPKKWVENENLEYKKSYKWRLANPEHIFDVPFYDRRFIAADLNNYDFIEFVGTLASEPYDPLLRWIIFLLDYGLTNEEVITAGEELWVNTKEEDNFIWGDISLTHLLTYNTKLDEYKYEIKNFNRLMKGIDFLRVAENTLARDKLKHYEERFKLVSNTIIMENEDIFEDILKERRLIRAKMLHKTLARNRLQSKYDKDEAEKKEQEREFYFTKKKEFFEELLIEEFWDWQAEYDEGITEDKYFNSRDIDNKTYDAQIYEEYFLKNCKRLGLDYLINHIVLKSYDQTMEEIYYFLTFKVWKILEKTLKGKNKQIEINYKNLNISDEYLSRINYDEHIILKTRTKFNKKTNQEEWEEYYEYRYKKLEWEIPQQEAIYGFKESNTLAEYFEAGEYYTYEIKIQYNEEALKYAKPPKIFHGQEVLQKWMKMVSTRYKTLQNIRKKYIKKKKKLPLNIAYINNIKWTWEQWIIYTDVETENELLNKNTVILNERFSLWNLKRVPIRVKLPIALNANLTQIEDYILDKSNYMSLMNHRHIMMLSDISPLLKQGLVWEQCKIMLEKRFNKSIQELILWIFTAEIFDREMFKIKRDYQFVLKNFVQNYGVFHKLYFLGMPQYTWDLIRYHEAWWGRDEFPYDRYFQLKQIEFLNHDPSARRIVRFLYNLHLDKYSPASFVFFFKNQFAAHYLYHVYGILSIGSLIWTIKVLMYNPGQYLADNFILFWPIFFTLGFWFLRRSLKGVKELKDSGELYLYKYHSSRVMTGSELLQRKLRLEKKKTEWTEHFYDADKIQELFPNGIRSMNTDLMPNWWRYHSHRNKFSQIYMYSHGVWWFWLYIAYFASFYWNVYKFKHRNDWWLWDYYRYDEELIKELKAKGLLTDDIRAPKSYKEKQWFIDSWARLENGGNWYTRWYENYYRKRKGLNKLELDYGHDWQKISNVDIPIVIDKKTYHFPGAVADVNWIVFSRHIEAFNKLPEEVKDLRTVPQLRDTIHKISPAMKKVLARKKKSKKRKRLEKRFSKLEKKRERQHFQEIFEERMKYQHHDIERREFTNLEILKASLSDMKSELKEELKKWYLGKRYIAKNHPYARLGELIYWLEDNVGYNTTAHVYARFLLDAKKQTKFFIQKDLLRYKYKNDYIIDAEIWKVKTFYDNYLNIFKYMKEQKIKRNQELVIAKSKCFYKGETMDIRTLLSISEKELHVANLRFFLLKSKQYRILKILIKNKKYYIGDKDKLTVLTKYNTIKNNIIWELKIYDTISRWSYFDIIKSGMKKLSNWAIKRTNLHYYRFRIKKMKEIDFYKLSYEKTANKLRRYNNYLKDLPKRIDATEKYEYRWNLIINFFKDKKDFWIFINDFFNHMSLLDLFKFIIQIIFKLFE